MSRYPVRKQGRRRAAGLASLGLLVPLIALAGGSADAETPPVAPHVELSAPAKLTAYASGRHLYTDLGLRMIAIGGDLELRLERPDYDSGVIVSRREADDTMTVLGEGLTESLNGLEDFLHLRFEPLSKKPGPKKPGKKAGTKAGTRAGKPFTRRIDACLGGVSERIDPGAAPRSPYPQYCNYNPYSLGAVQGISAGYAATVLDPWDSTVRGVSAGRYDVTISVATPWADALGMAPEERVRTMRLIVKSYDDCEGRGRGCRRAAEESPRTQPGGSRALTPGPRASARGAVTEEELPEGTPLPDLRALPAWGIQISRNGNFLQFSATVWNGGNTPLVVDGFRRAGADIMDGYQYFFDADGEQLPDYVDVGEFEWDPKPTHLHWHFRSFAAYSLLPPGHTPEAPDGHDHGIDSRKEAFCLANTDAVDLTGEGAQWNVDNSDLSTACGGYESLSVRQALAAGWGDTYAQFRAGQSFDLRGLENGCYDIWVEGNPIVDHDTDARTLIESDYTNNTAKRRVCIGGKPGARKIRSIEPIGIIDETAMWKF